MDTAELRTLTQLLDLAGFEVVEAARDVATQTWRLTVVATTLAQICPHCHSVTGNRHACHDRTIVDLPLGGWRTELVVRMLDGAGDDGVVRAVLGVDGRRERECAWKGEVRRGRPRSRIAHAARRVARRRR